MSKRTDRLRSALDAVYGLERKVRDFVREVPPWSQRYVWFQVTEADQNRWDIPDGWFRRLFREEEPTEAQALAQDRIAEWMESMLPEPLAPQVQAGFDRLPEGQKRALAQHCVERWVAERERLPIPPVQPDELCPPPRDVGEGEDYEEAP